MPKPRLTKENGALVLNLDLLPDCFGEEKTPVVPIFLAGYLSQSIAMLFIRTLRQTETGQGSNE